MPTPTPRNEGIWRDAEALIERVESAARNRPDAPSFFDDLVEGLRLTTGAAAVTLSIVQGDEFVLLARSGILLHGSLDNGEAGGDSNPGDPGEQGNDDPIDFASRCKWSDGEFGSRLNASQSLQPGHHLQLDFSFEEAPEFGLRAPISELAEVLLDLAMPVVLREELGNLQKRVSKRTDRDELIRDLNQGIGLSDSFSSIATCLASACQLDRVSLLQSRGNRFRVVTTSACQKVVRRARQVRLMEQLVETVLSESDAFHYQVGGAAELDEGISSQVSRYCDHSGFREIHIRLMGSRHGQQAAAAIVVESFQAPGSEDEQIPRKLQTLFVPLEDAVVNALKRTDAGWGFLASLLFSPENRKKLLLSVAALFILAAALLFVPMELRLSVSGRVVAAEQHRLFAPSEGIVSDISVSNGDAVKSGSLLVQMRSPTLDLQRRTVEGELATAETRLVSLAAMRSSSSAVSNRQREAEIASEELVLRKEIEGLHEQLRILDKQQSGLTIESPMNGIVDRWDLRQSLESRPVSHGQYLLDVISESAGWTIELDLPEENINYVMKQQRQSPCRCSFRLRSDPTQDYYGEIAEIAGVANLGLDGQSIVTATFPVNVSRAVELRNGATVVAQVECGKYPLGFVLFRGLIQWYRSNPWF